MSVRWRKLSEMSDDELIEGEQDTTRSIRYMTADLERQQRLLADVRIERQRRQKETK